MTSYHHMVCTQTKITWIILLKNKILFDDRYKLKSKNKYVHRFQHYDPICYYLKYDMSDKTLQSKHSSGKSSV